MGIRSDLEKEVGEIFATHWNYRDGQVVPEPPDIKLGDNDAVELDATVLYADMAGSTSLVDDYQAWFAANVYKTYLRCAAKIIASEGGKITAYDGDRVMAVFIGDLKNTTAARTALKINYARIHIVNDAIRARNFDLAYEVQHSIGIDSSKLTVVRTGVRGANDLVWIGRAANYAAKLSSLPPNYSYITPEAYARLRPEVKVSNGRNMWESANAPILGGIQIYRSSWTWEVS